MLNAERAEFDKLDDQLFVAPNYAIKTEFWASPPSPCLATCCQAALRGTCHLPARRALCERLPTTLNTPVMTGSHSQVSHKRTGKMQLAVLAHDRHVTSESYGGSRASIICRFPKVCEGDMSVLELPIPRYLHRAQMHSSRPLVIASKLYCNKLSSMLIMTVRQNSRWPAKLRHEWNCAHVFDN